jgi:hypothetical protein
MMSYFNIKNRNIVLKCIHIRESYRTVLPMSTIVYQKMFIRFELDFSNNWAGKTRMQPEAQPKLRQQRLLHMTHAIFGIAHFGCATSGCTVTIMRKSGM